MNNRYCFLTLPLVLGLVLQGIAKDEQLYSQHEVSAYHSAVSDSIAGIQKTPARYPDQKPIVANRSKEAITGKSRNILGEKSQQLPTEVLASLKTRPRGFREMRRGFREMEQDEKLMDNEFKTEEEQAVLAYPNPASSYVKLKINTAMQVEKVDIFDASGTLIVTWEFASNPWGQEMVELNTEQLEAGTYILRPYGNGFPLPPVRIIISR